MKPFDPKSTTFTNLALDKIMPIVSPNAWKILCYAIRKTAGWVDDRTESGRKESDVISISQFREGCGIASNDTVMNAISECLNSGYLIRYKEGSSFRYCINRNYELPTITETVTPTITDSVTMTVTETVNTNNKLNNNININSNKENTQSNNPARKNGNSMRTKEELMQSTEDALFKSFTSGITGYAHFPEELIPVVQKMETLWHFKSPRQSKKRNGEYAFWIESCRDILDACGEFGVDLLDDLHKDWSAYMETHAGLAPYAVSSPKSLLSAVRGKAALLRSGNKSPFWKLTDGVVKHQSRLDV